MAFSDHAGGNTKLIEMRPGLAVYGGDKRIDGITQYVKHGDKLQVRK